MIYKTAAEGPKSNYFINKDYAGVKTFKKQNL